MAQYRLGTVSVTNADATVTGSGTAWLTELTAGDLFIVQGLGVVYEVLSVTTDTELELTAAYAGDTETAQRYVVVRDFTAINGLPLLNVGDLETVAIYNHAMTLVDGLL